MEKFGLLLAFGFIAVIYAYPRHHSNKHIHELDVANPPAWLSDVLTESELQRMRDLKEMRQWDEIKRLVAGALRDLPLDQHRTIFGHKRYRRPLQANDDDIPKWLNEAQRTEIEQLKSDGVVWEAIKAKIVEAFDTLPQEKKEGLTKKYNKHCFAWIKKVSTKEERNEIKELHASGDLDALTEVLERLTAKADTEVQEAWNKWGDECLQLWEIEQEKQEVAMRLRLSLKEEVQDWLSWLSHEQKTILKQLEEQGMVATDAIKAKVREMFNELPSHRQNELLEKFESKCENWIERVADDEEKAELMQLRETGEHEQFKSKIDQLFLRLPHAKQQRLGKFHGICSEVWKQQQQSARRWRRDIDPEFADWLGWMTEEQKETVRESKESGKSLNELKVAVKEFFDQLGAERQSELKETFKTRCHSFFTQVANEAEVEELKKLHEEGKNKKLNELVDSVIERMDDDVKSKATKLKTICSDLYRDETLRTRTRRDLKESLKKYLGWLTAEQKNKLKAMKKEGKSHDEMKIKVWEFYTSLEGEAKKTAEKQLKKSCASWLEPITSEEERAELKQLHESGGHAECKAKVMEYFERLAPETKEKVAKYRDICMKIWYGEHSTERRHNHSVHDHSEHGHDHDSYKDYIKWMSDDQKSTLKELKESGSTYAEMRDKTIEFYEALEGEEKQKAKEQLKKSCISWIANVANEEEKAEIKTLHEGDDKVALETKLEELAGRLPPKIKEKLEEVRGVCKKLWGVESESRRDEHEHSYETLENKFLTWLTDEQKEEMKTLNEGDATKEEMRDKVMEFYEASDGEVKEEATRKMQGACRMLIAHVVGKEKAEEMKALREGGATEEELMTKAEELISQVEDEKKKEMANRHKKNCKKIFGIGEDESRLRREAVADKAKHEAFAKKFLTWLTEEQKTELKTMYDGRSEHSIIRDKVMEFYDAAEGDVKEEATRKLKGACRFLIVKVVGEEKAAELKELKEGGATEAVLTAKIDEVMGHVDDQELKYLAGRYKAQCKKIFGLESARFRRHYEHLKQHLKWLNAEQKTEVEELKAQGGKKADLKVKIIEFFGQLSAERQEELKTKWKGKCISWVKEVANQHERDELKQLHANENWKELKEKIDIYIERMDAEKKMKVTAAREICEKLFHVDEMNGS